MGGVLARKTPCRNAHTDVLFFLLYSTFNWKCNHNSKIFGQDEQPPNARQLLGLQKKKRLPWRNPGSANKLQKGR